MHVHVGNIGIVASLRYLTGLQHVSWVFMCGFSLLEALPAPTFSLASDFADLQHLHITILAILQDHVVSLSRQNVTELVILRETMLFGQHFVILQIFLPA